MAILFVKNVSADFDTSFYALDLRMLRERNRISLFNLHQLGLASWVDSDEWPFGFRVVSGVSEMRRCEEMYSGIKILWGLP